MRNTWLKASRALLTLTIIGISSIVFAFLYFSGVVSLNRELLDADFKMLLAFGFYLTIMTLLPILSTMDTRWKMSLRKIYPHLLVMTFVGFLGFIYSLLVYGTYLDVFNATDTWFDYLSLSIIALIICLIPLLYSVRDRDQLWSLKFGFLLFIIIGLILEILAIVVYSQMFDQLISDLGLPLISGTEWEVFFLVGGVFLVFGVFPLFVTASTDFSSFIHRTRIIWIVGILISLITVILSFLVNNNVGVLDSEALMNIEWEAFFLFGSLFLIFLTVLLASSQEFNETLRKVKILWILLLIVGVIVVIVSFAALGLGMEFWDFYYMYGSIISFFAIIPITSILYFETSEISGDFQAMDVSTDSFLDIKTTPTEMNAYLEILSKNESNLIGEFKDALRANKFRPRVYESLVKHYEGRIKSYKTKIGSLQKTSVASAAEEDKVGSLFDSVLGEPTKAKAPSVPSTPPPPPSADAKPAQIPSTPPPPPPSTSAPPPPAPSISAPPSTPPIPPASTPSPTPPSESSVLSAGKPSESPLDLIADARSTSIAELRGEMLKELRRLREIFKEE